jgi:uncharacterized membrane protein
MKPATDQRLTFCRRIVAAGAVYDLISIGPLAFPFSAPAQLNLMFDMNKLLGFEGVMPTFEPIHILFVNLFGMLLAIWAGFRLLAFRPAYAVADFAVRVCVSVLLFWYATNGEVHRLVLLFLFAELLFALANFRAMKHAGLTQSAPALIID